MNRKNARLAAVVSAVVGAIAFTPAAQAHAKTVNYTTKDTLATLSTGNGYPNPGGTALLAGTIQAKPFGAGALVDHVKITGHPEPNVFTFKGVETVFYAHGTMRDTYTGTSTVNDDGSLDLVTTGTYTGGTGRYKGTTGHYKSNARAESGSTIVHGTSSGRVIY